MKAMKWILVALFAVSMSGCVAWTAAPSTGKKAFVVKGNIFKTDMYHCDATSGQPGLVDLLSHLLAQSGPF